MAIRNPHRVDVSVMSFACKLCVWEMHDDARLAPVIEHHNSSYDRLMRFNHDASSFDAWAATMYNEISRMVPDLSPQQARVHFTVHKHYARTPRWIQLLPVGCPAPNPVVPTPQPVPSHEQQNDEDPNYEQSAAFSLR